MNGNLKKLLTIDLRSLLRVNLSRLTLLPTLMIIAVVINKSISITVLGYNMLSYLALALSLLSFVVMSYIYIRRGTMSKIVLIVIAFVMVLTASTVINGNDIKMCFYDACSLMFIAMVCDYYKDRFHMLIVAFAIAFSICAYLNLMHMLTHPELWIIDDTKTNQGYILGGNYNQMGARLLCAVGTSVACLKHSKWWLLNVIPVTLVSIVTLVIVQSMTALSGIMLLLAFSMIPSAKLLKAGILSLLAFVFLFQVFVCFQGKGIEQSPLAVYIVEDVLGKDITFTYRTYLWDAAGKIFANSPIFGYGCVDNDWYYSHMSSIAKGTHNYIWGILVSGGILLLAVFTYICLLVFHKFLSTNDRYTLLLYAITTVLFLMMLMENYPHLFILTLLLLTSCASHLNKEEASWNLPKE